ncbi:hypothetical protein FACS1894208_02430 [Clostridia bacterium]|nr:hypothetical protein FACS1894208_02430 [Clostridia bacterium]
MNKDTVQLMVDRKTAQVVHEVSKKLNMRYDAVFHMFCGSDTYRKLSDFGTKYWKESIPYIVESFIAERNNAPINDDY